MAIGDFSIWLDGQPQLTESDGSFTIWCDGEPVVAYAEPASSATSLVVDNAYHAHAAAASDLTQSHALSPAGAYHAHSAPNLTVTQSATGEVLYSATIDSRSSGWGGDTVRTIIPAGYFKKSASRIKVKFRAGSSYALNLSKVYIGHQGSTSLYAFDGNQVKLQFSSADTLDLAAGADGYSDEINFSLDNSKPIIIAAYITPTTSGGSGYISYADTWLSVSWYKTGDDAATTEASSYSASSVLKSVLVSEIYAVTVGNSEHSGTELFSARTKLRGIDHQSSGYTARSVIPASALPTAASRIKLLLAAGVKTAYLYGVKPNKVYIGHRAATGDAYDFDGNQVQVLFDGAAGVSIDLCQQVWSDEVDFALDPTKDLIIAVYQNSSDTTNDCFPFWELSGVASYYKSGDSAADADVSGYSTYTGALAGVCLVVGIYSATASPSSLVVDNAPHALASGEILLSQKHSLSVAPAHHAHTAPNLTVTESTTAVELVVASAYHAQTAGAVDLVQAHALIVQGAYHGHVSGTADLEHHHVLSVDGAYHVQAVDNIVLSGGVSLTVSGSYHAHAAQAADLTQAHSLAVSSCFHEHAAQNASLTGTQALVVDDSAHEHFAEGLDISTLYLLTVADCYHAHDGPSLALTQAHSLDTATAHHGHTASEISLSGTASLLVDSAAHEQAAGNVDLYQVYNLKAQNSAHVTSANSFALTGVHILAIQDATHTSHADALALSGIHNLALDDSAHAHFGESLHNLPSDNMLDVSWRSYHTHSAENVTLTQSHNLVVADGYHDQAAETVALTQRHRLTPAHCHHGHFCSTILFSAIAKVQYTQLHSLTAKTRIRTLTPNTTVERFNGTTRIAA
jgi:hypothetical protein